VTLRSIVWKNTWWRSYFNSFKSQLWSH